MKKESNLRIFTDKLQTSSEMCWHVSEGFLWKISPSCK